MLKRYRRRFVVSTMALISLVLILALAAHFIMLYRNTWSEMKNTMSLVVGPWVEPGDSFRSLEPERPRDRPEGDPEAHMPPERSDQQELPHIAREKIVTVFLDSDTGTVSILDPENTRLDNALIYEAVRQALDKEGDFGVIRSLGLIYYREASQEHIKFAFADISYVRTRLLSSFLELLLVFILAMVLFCFISIWLSRRAARPMEQALEMERQFVADISHDLKTPITVIAANNSILRADPEAKVGDQLQWINSSDAAARNMTQLIEQMLTLSSLESAELTVRKESLDFSHILEKCILQMESIAYDRGITLDSEIAEGIQITGNLEYAERICTGLVENALKYEPEGGRILVRLSRQKKKALLLVENAGSVIAPEDLPHIFERFYRGDKTRNQQKGFGLGLPIIKQMTELMGGYIRAESNAEQGTAFLVSLNADEP